MQQQVGARIEWSQQCQISDLDDIKYEIEALHTVVTVQ